MALNLVAGIWTKDWRFELATMLDADPLKTMLPAAFAFACDDNGGHLFVIAAGSKDGQIRYLPSDILFDPERAIREPYFVAEDIQAFVEILEADGIGRS
jgi:hypothetical protein